MILVVDNFDSFTYNLVDYLLQLDFIVEIKRNNAPMDDFLTKKYKAIVLSPGPGIPEKAGNLMNVIDHYHDKIPILGICLGQQAITAYFNGNIEKAQQPMHGKISAISHRKDSLFSGIPTEFKVTRYHSLICTNLPRELESLATTKINEVMALKHKELPIYGLQFHPEAVLTEYGLDILRNWKNINALTN